MAEVRVDGTKFEAQFNVFMRLLASNPGGALQMARRMRQDSLRQGETGQATRALSLTCMAYRALGRHTAWRRSARKLAREQPNDWGTFADLGMAEEATGNIQAAIDAYERALAMYRDEGFEFADMRPDKELKQVIEETLRQLRAALGKTPHG